MRERRGFTLIELIIAMAISAVVLAVLTTFVVFILNINKKQESFVEAQDAIRIAGLRIEKDIRQSSQEITIETVPNCTTIHDIEQNIQYCLVGNQLMREGSLIASNIQAFSIALIPDQDLIEITITGNYEGEVINYEQTIYLRIAE